MSGERQKLNIGGIVENTKARYIKRDLEQTAENLDVPTDARIDSIYRSVVVKKRKDFLIDFEDSFGFLENTLFNVLETKEKKNDVVMLKKIRLILSKMEEHWQKKDDARDPVSLLIMVKEKISEIDKLLLKYS